MSQANRQLRRLQLMASVLAGMAASAGAAETAGLQVEEVVVTATRRTESVQDVPYNIQAISAQTLEHLGARDQSDFARMIPGLSMVDNGARNGVEFVLRGLTTGSNDDTLGQTTSTYVDDTQIDLYTGLLDLKILDVERIEVLRGPQGTLYGGGAIGGTIRYITTPPDLGKTQARVGSTLSSTAHGGTNYDVTGMLNVPLITDKVALRSSMGYFDNDGFIDNVRTGAQRVNWDQTFSGRWALLAKPIDELEIALTHYHQRGDYGDDGTQYEQLGARRSDTYAPNGSSRERVDLSNLSVTYDFGWAELTSSSSYVRERSRAYDDNTFFIRDEVFASFVPPEVLPEMTVTTDRRRRAETFSQELRLVSAGTERWDWAGGLYYYDREAFEDLQERVPTGFPGQAGLEALISEWGEYDALLNDNREYTFRADPSTIQQWAAFGEVGFKFTPQLRMSVGARHFDYRLRETFYAIDQYFGPEARDENGLARTVPLESEYNFGKADDDGEIYRLNASYDYSEDGLLFLTVAEGYRPGGFNLVTPNTGVPLDERQYDPDSITSYEIGGKMSLLDRAVYLSTGVYYIDWSDIQTLVPTDLGFVIFGNAGKATARGFELELQTRGLLVDNLSLMLGYSYTKVQLEEAITNLGLAGDRAPRVPEHNGSFSADYQFLLAGEWRSGVTLSTSYTGQSFSTFGPVVPDSFGDLVGDDLYLQQDAYWLSDLSLRLENEKVQVRLFVDNVFDELADLSRTRDGANSQYRSPSNLRITNQPRTVGVQFTWYVK